MAKLSLKFEKTVLKEMPVGSRPIGSGRAPDKDLGVETPAVSNYTAKG